MERRKHFLFKFLVFLALTIPVHSQDQSGFISIDCGLPANTSYTDQTTGLNYISDARFISTGISKGIAPEYNTDTIGQQQLYVRSFPEGDRNCYNVSDTRGTKYLIRAIFMYGNYDGLNKLPAFDLYLGTDKVFNVQILNASVTFIKEIIHTSSSDNLYVCLVNSGSGIPFISALEFRPLKNSTYVTHSGSLVKFARLDVGSAKNQTVRYPDDVFDRMWAPYHFYKWTDLSTTKTIDAQNHNDFQPPSTVMSTASTPKNASEDMEFFLDVQDPTQQFYVYMHFAEIGKLAANQSRTFNISLDGKKWYGPVAPDYLYTLSVYSTSALTGGNYTFSLIKTGGSTLPPILNAIEVYYVVNLLQVQTDQGDIDAVMSIKSAYGIVKNWQGDPCLPQAYMWEGLNCSYNNNPSPTIISLDLPSSGLTGQIPPDIANLKSLQILDLSNNSFSGQVPSFLSQLPSLKVLVGGNPDLCQSTSCEKKKNNVVVPVVASIAAVIVVGSALTTILLIYKRREQQAGKVETGTNRSQDLLESKNRQFTYSDVLKITNNFAKVLGKGGFGTVYHGFLDDTQVAVKMLSPSSVQGYKEFQAEVKLLLRVHHGTLTTLIGYCQEGTNLGLIYEYMANGNLEDHLSANNPDVLSWEARLRIALESAQGLEYLHNGCKPPIVHRDVKTTNILLNDKFQAKLADFGLSRTFPVEGGTHVSTIVAGTPGYLDPEYYVTNWLTEKSDVYSFGVVLLEIITGKPVIVKTRDKVHISQWTSSMLENGDARAIADPRLGTNFNINTLWKVAELALACVSTTSAKRPSMNQVVVELNECLAMEMDQTSQYNESNEFMTVNLHTGMSPLVR